MKREAYFLFVIVSLMFVFSFAFVQFGKITGNVITNPSCSNADLNHDGVVDMADENVLEGSWVSSCNSPDWCWGADLNQDGIVNWTDSLILDSYMNMVCDTTPKINNLYPLDNSKIIKSCPDCGTMVSFNFTATSNNFLGNRNTSGVIIYNSTGVVKSGSRNFSSSNVIVTQNYSYIRTQQVGSLLGSYFWVAYARDSNGLVNYSIPRRIEISFNQDLPPQIILIYPLAENVLKTGDSSLVSFNFSVGDDYELNLSNATGIYIYNSTGSVIKTNYTSITDPVNSGNFSFSFILNIGDYSWIAYARDNSSNVTYSEKRNFFIRANSINVRDSPVITKIYPLNNSILKVNQDSEIVFNFTAADDDGLSRVGVLLYDLNGELIDSQIVSVSGSKSAVSIAMFALPDKYLWRAYARDIGGTESYSSYVKLEVASDGSIASLKCPDGTVQGACSLTKPLYCLKGTLVNDCETCGCSAGYGCNNDGKCIQKLSPPPSSSILGNLSTFWWTFIILGGIVLVLVVVLLIVFLVKRIRG